LDLQGGMYNCRYDCHYGCRHGDISSLKISVEKGVAGGYAGI